MTDIRWRKDRPDQPRRAPGSARLVVVGIALLLVLGVGIALIARSGRGGALGQLLTSGEVHRLQPALFQSAPLRTARGGPDRVYLLSTQSESVTGIGRRGGLNRPHRDYLHLDLWAVDAASGRLAWRKRLRTYEGTERQGRDLLAFALLGVDGNTLWLTVDGPLGVSLADGSVVADGARIDAKNPALAGKRVDERGYVAFGRHGLQLTLNDASQWRIDASDLGAAPRDTPVRDPDGIVAPADTGSTSHFVTRGLPIGEHWLGVLTDQEADTLRKPPVIAGRDPNERPGVMQQFLEENHVPGPLYDLLPQPYRLWSARMVQVSAAPPGWPTSLPDRWGKRPKFSDYAPLPQSPPFLRAGLLRDDGRSEQALWYRQPDSVLVLHSDKLGREGRLQLTRVSGPAGAVVWRRALPMDALRAVMRKDDDLLLFGSESVAADARTTEDDDTHLKIARVDVKNGNVTTLDLTAESLVAAR